MLREVIVVEGKNDAAAVRRAVEAEVIVTGGFSLNGRVWEKIAVAYAKRGIIILTDPDQAGEKIRKTLSSRFPAASHAFVAKEDAAAGGDIGVENASPETIRSALAKTRGHLLVPRREFTAQDLIAAGLSGGDGAVRRRAHMGDALGIGYANAKNFLYRLNAYGVSRREFAEALAKPAPDSSPEQPVA
jgi:ribonuclease M5